MGFRLKKKQVYLLGLLILPWLSIPFLGKKDFKRFLPGTLFMSFFLIGESYVAKKRVWWWFYPKLFGKIPGMEPLIWGPFFIGTLWILKSTFKSFPKYFIVNLITDSFFVYGCTDWLRKMGYCSLVRMKKAQLLCLFTLKTIILYLFQYGYEKIKGPYSENVTK